MARVDRSETDAQAFRSQTLSLTAKDLTQTNAAAKAELDRLTSIIKTLHRDSFGKRSEKLGADDAEYSERHAPGGYPSGGGRLALIAVFEIAA